MSKQRPAGGAATAGAAMRMQFLSDPECLHLLLIGENYETAEEFAARMRAEGIIGKGRKIDALRGGPAEKKDASLDNLPTCFSPEGMNVRDFVRQMTMAMDFGLVFTDQDLPKYVHHTQPFALQFFPQLGIHEKDSNLGMISCDLLEEKDCFVQLLQKTAKFWLPDPAQLQEFLNKQNDNKNVVFEMRWQANDDKIKERIATYISDWNVPDAATDAEKIEKVFAQVRGFRDVMAKNLYPMYSWVILTTQEFKKLVEAETPLLADMIRKIGKDPTFVFNSPVEVSTQKLRKKGIIPDKSDAELQAEGITTTGYVDPERLGALCTPGEQADTAEELATKDSITADQNWNKDTDKWHANTFQVRDVATAVEVKVQPDKNNEDGFTAMAGISMEKQVRGGDEQLDCDYCEPEDVGATPLFPLLQVKDAHGNVVLQKTTVWHGVFVITPSKITKEVVRSTVVKCIACETALHTLKGPVRVTGCGHVGLCGECQDEWKGACPECRDPVKCDQVVVFKLDGEPCTVQPDAEADEEGMGGSAKDAKPQTGAVGEDDPSGKFSKGKQPVRNALPFYEAMSARNGERRCADSPALGRRQREQEEEEPTASSKKPNWKDQKIDGKNVTVILDSSDDE
jgi:hypothetical protein